MNSNVLKTTLKEIELLMGRTYDAAAVESGFDFVKKYAADEAYNFVSDLMQKASTLEMAVLPNYLDEEDFEVALENLEYPAIVIKKTDAGFEPFIIVNEKRKGNKCLRCKEEDVEVLQISSLDFASLLKAEPTKGEEYKDSIIFLTCYPWQSLVTEQTEVTEQGKKLRPFDRLMRLLANEKKDIYYIYVYAVTVGLISLSLPIGIQAIINLISGGLVLNSVVVLIALVVLGVLITGGLQIMQITIVEILQRRVFTKAAYEFAFRIPRLKMEKLGTKYPPELVNRFFDVLTLQKGLPKLLIDLSAALLQILFGLILLAFYHPLFILFGLFLVGFVTLIFVFTGKKGLDSKLKESSYKYNMVQWLEELARVMPSFKMAGATNLPLKKADILINKYLKYRKIHFGVIITQFANLVVFKTLITGGLLILGTILVVDRQITLGQFVASEVIIIIVVSAVEKIILNIDVVYDLLVGVEKIAYITDLPLERPKGIESGLHRYPEGLEVKISKLNFTYKGATEPTLKEINLHIKAGEFICLSGYDKSGKETLSRFISGIYTEYKGSVQYNGISMKDLNINYLRNNISRGGSRGEIFEGTVLENITLGKPQASFEELQYYLERTGLINEINSLKDGLLTELHAEGHELSSSSMEKLVLVRSLLNKPKLLVLPTLFGNLHKEEVLKMLNLVLDKSKGWTVVIRSNNPMIQAACDRVVLLENGSVKAEGKYEDIKHLLN
jgi:ABC-type bacteriocin/lantibiotic exporter with double-glycine peptidase domain